MSLRAEIGETGAAVARLIEGATPSVEAIAAAVRGREIGFVVIAARGTSDHAAMYAQYVLGARNGLTVALAAPSLVSLYERAPDVTRALVVGISQAGRSPDVVAVVEDARRQGALTVAITNDRRSPLADAAELLIDLAAGPELAVAATKTYVAELTAVALLSRAIDGRADAAADASLAGLPAAMAAALATEPQAELVARAHAGLDRCIVIGRGFQYPTAREWALKLKEIAGVSADPYSAADFEHGPITLVGPGTSVIAVATTGPALAGVESLLERLRQDGADLLIASDDEAARRLGSAALALPAGVPEWIAPIPAIVPAQLFAYHLALAKGIDPERPPHLRKVTLTR
jgi:glucosamine--fructose-6-phosphate aminotransferase (isomerizing)